MELLLTLIVRRCSLYHQLCFTGLY